MAKEKNEKEMAVCPMCRFFGDMEKVFDKESKFFEHLNQSRIEFLKAIKTLVDGRIENLEKKGGKGKKKVTKIKVE